MTVRSLVAAAFVLFAWGTSDVLRAESTASSRPAAAAPDYGLAVWAADKGQPPGDVFAIAQDTEGYLWLGTPNGLHRFDGARFQPWISSNPETALPNGPIHALVGSPDGGIWIGFGGGGSVVRILRGRVTRYSPGDGAPPGVTAMIQDRQGAIWVAARRGLYRFFNNHWSLIGDAEGYNGAEAFSLYEDRAGRVWAGTASGVFRREREKFELVDRGETNVQSLTEDAAGGIWVSDSVEILKKLSTHAAPRHGREIRLPAGAWRLMRDGRNQIWAAAFGGGLMRVRDPLAPAPSLERFEYEHRLPGSPRSVFEDREGNIWVGMRGGLIRLSERSFTNVPLEGLNNDGVRTSAVGSDGSVWVATGHGLNRFSGGRRTAYDVSQTMALHSDRKGVMWIAGGQRISRFRDGRFDLVTIPGAVPTARVMALTTDAHDSVWFCTALKGVMSWDGQALSRFEKQAELNGKGCQSIYTDSQDRVWIGLISGGAVLYDKGTFRSFTERDGLARGTVLAIIEDRHGAIWLSATGGVSRYEHGRFTTLTPVNAPLTDLVPVLVEDLDGHIWVGVNSGAAMMRFPPSEVDKVAGSPMHQVEYSLYDETDGMQQGSQTWQSGVGGVRDTDGRLWVATGLGMTLIDPRQLPTTHRPPPPRIESVTADGRRVTPTRDLTLPSSTSTLRIDFGTVSLSSASKLRFRYLLEGVDEDWVYAGSGREAMYANVPSGNYRFRVSTTANGEWTEAARWEFAVAPPFFRTPTFLTSSVLSLAMIVAMAWWLRLRAVRNQYALVFAERARVSREIHDTLLQSLAAIGVELETIATELGPSQTPARDGLRRLRRQISHCLREARESILELRHQSLKPMALVDSLRELAVNTTSARGVQTEFTVTGRPRPGLADADRQLLRIAQESVNNAIRHGRARTVRINLAFDDDRVVLTVSDDGCGFEPGDREAAPSTGEHLGLLTMRERAARIRGQLAIISRPGQGTTIETSAPVGAE
ncbi:MAG TPA: two-component regulator propeller domain-containing protein [Vicinamibacterales bacterium]|jgi:signal transduction histidine kinase/ligand-binding sensor domain-containing protein